MFATIECTSLATGDGVTYRVVRHHYSDAVDDWADFVLYCHYIADLIMRDHNLQTPTAIFHAHRTSNYGRERGAEVDAAMRAHVTLYNPVEHTVERYHLCEIVSAPSMHTYRQLTEGACPRRGQTSLVRWIRPRPEKYNHIFRDLQHLAHMPENEALAELPSECVNRIQALKEQNEQAWAEMREALDAQSITAAPDVESDYETEPPTQPDLLIETDDLLD